MVELPEVVAAAVNSGSASAALGWAAWRLELLAAAPKMNCRRDDDETVAARAATAKVIKPSNTSRRAGLPLILMVLVESERRKEFKGG